MNVLDKKIEKKEDEFEEQVIDVSRVSRTMAGGRRISFRAAVAVGNHKGKIGIGVGKSKEVVDAVAKAVKKAKKELIQVPIVNETIPYEVKIGYKGSKILLKPAPLGSGIIAGGVVRIMANLAGISNILSKSLGSSNKLNNLKATIMAFKELSQVQEKVKISNKSSDSKISAQAKTKKNK